MQIPIDDGIKAGSDTNLSIICRVVAMTGNALNMRKNNKIRFAIVFVCCIRCKDSERWVQRQTEIVFPIWLCRTVFYLRSYKDSERWAQRCEKRVFFAFLSSCILSCVYRRKDKPKEKAILFTWRFCFSLGRNSLGKVAKIELSFYFCWKY